MRSRYGAGPLIPQRIAAARPVPKEKRVHVGNHLPGEHPRTKPEVDEWTEVVDELEYTVDGQWTLVAEVATEDAANLVVERLGQHFEIQAAIRVFGVADYRVFAQRIKLSRGAT